MDFKEIVRVRQSCRKYSDRAVDDNDIKEILEEAILAPSACNSQPYHFTVCKGEMAQKVAKACQGVGLNGFVKDAPVLIVISEAPYNKTAAIGAKFKGNDYRSIDIGIATAYITSSAAERGLSSCIIGWLDDKKIREICALEGAIRLVICIGYADESDSLRNKKRKSYDDMVSEI